MELIPLGIPAEDDSKAASRHLRTIFFCKFLLFAAVLPIAIAALFELPHIYDRAESQLQATPILAIITLGSIYLAIGLFCLKAFALYFPVFGPLCGAPIHFALWHSTMFTIGLLFDAMVLTPRILLGSAIDWVWRPEAIIPDDYLFTRKASALLVLLAPIAVATCLVWHPFYTDYVARARAEYETKHYFNLTVDELNWWYEFDDEIRRALNAQTFDEALASVEGLREVVAYLPYRDEKHRRKANEQLDWAESHLNTSLGTRRTHPDLWQPQFRNILAGVTRYHPQRAEIPEPHIDPMPFDESLKYATPSETLLPPPEAANHLAANTNPVTPSEVSESPFQTESPGQANRTRPPRESTLTPENEPPESTPTRPPQKPSESAPKSAPEPSQSNANPVERTTSPVATADDLAADVPPNPFQKGTTWTGMSLQISDGGINPQVNDGAKIEIELSIKQHDADQFEGIVRCPWATTAQGRRVRWGATASARGTYQDGEVTIETKPLHVPAGTVLLPGTWTGTVSEDVFSGEFRGNNNGLSEITLKKRGATNRRQ